jgi:hypothetical protein
MADEHRTKRDRHLGRSYIEAHGHPLWRDVALVVVPILLALALAISAAVWLLHPAPPHTVYMSAGPRESLFMQTALQYKTILARDGIDLEVLESDGSVENLKRLLAPGGRVEIALVQSGVSEGASVASLVSLGSVFYIPLVVFYRGDTITRLSQLEGRRVAIGPEGSGTRQLALKLFAANGIVPGGKTALLPLDAQQAASALVAGSIDAALLSGDSATRSLLLQLHETPGISFMDFGEARAYARLFPFLDEVDLPQGVLDLRQAIPPQTIHLISPTVEILARPTLHPAISDLIIAAAQEVHGSAGPLQSAGRFPNPVQREYRISEDALRYYKSGKSFFYRYLPFWLATILERLLVLILPAMILIVPGIKLVPAVIGWRMRSKIYRFYGFLIAIERRVISGSTEEDRQRLVQELDLIAASINEVRVPLAYADALYVLREHVSFVRSQLVDTQRTLRNG